MKLAKGVLLVPLMLTSLIVAAGCGGTVNVPAPSESPSEEKVAEEEEPIEDAEAFFNESGSEETTDES